MLLGASIVREKIRKIGCELNFCIRCVKSEEASYPNDDTTIHSIHVRSH